MKKINTLIENPLSELISDNIYDLLSSNRLINETSVRDFQMRMKYKQLRASNVSAGEALDVIKQKYSYLQFDTIKKIVYHVNTPVEK
jgi:hypothetical protein